MGFFNYVIANQSEIIQCLLEHIQLTLLSVSIAILIGVPLGILISYIKVINKPVLWLANVVQAVPSLALLGFLIPFVGIGTTPAIVMVVVYSLLPIIKNTATGLGNIDSDMLEAAKGIGMTRIQRLTRVKLPQAFPVIMAGVRISAVTSVGLVTMAAFIGAGGLGYLVYSGIRTVNNYQILAGAIPACILALLIDFIVSLIEKAVTPICFTDKIESANKKTITKHKVKKVITLVLSGLIIVGIFASNFVGGLKKEEKVIHVGAKDYTEQIVLGNILAELIDENTDAKVELTTELGSQVIFSAIQAKEIDLYADYTGTVYTSILDYTETKSTDETYNICKEELKEKYNLEMLSPYGYNNTYTLSVRQDTADKYNLKTFSDLAKVSDQLDFGGTFEILNRSDGIPGLTKTYSMEFKNEISIDGTPRYTAIKNDEIQITDAFSTDGMLRQYELVSLEDNKDFFPPYYASTVVRPDVLEEFPELESILEGLADTFTEEIMQEMNYKVDVLKENPKDVAREFLKEKDLI